MLRLAITCAFVALSAAMLGLGGLALAAVTLANVLFSAFVAYLLFQLVLNVARRVA